MVDVSSSQKQINFMSEISQPPRYVSSSVQGTGTAVRQGQVSTQSQKDVFVKENTKKKCSWKKAIMYGGTTLVLMLAAFLYGKSKSDSSEKLHKYLIEMGKKLKTELKDKEFRRDMLESMIEALTAAV